MRMQLRSAASRRKLITFAGLVACAACLLALALLPEPAARLTTGSAPSPASAVTVPSGDTTPAVAVPESRDAQPAAPAVVGALAVRGDKPAPVSRAAARQRSVLKRLLAPGRFAYHEIVRRTAARYRVEHRLVMAIIASESGGNPDAISPAGAIGLMQLMPETAERLGVDPWDPEQNVDGAVRYLAKQLSTFDSVDLSLVAYNAGPGFAEKYRRGHVELGAETRAFLTRVGQMLQ
ncbi:MAG: hypothetical protein EHM24_00445 [Acidobacteria bacterium]|nr:MAG: hypothetical protein EHM24_00445 [Acidobacteriota bacterium]